MQCKFSITNGSISNTEFALLVYIPPWLTRGRSRNVKKLPISRIRLDFAKLVVTRPAYLHLKIGHFCLVVNSINYVQIGVYYHRYYQSAASAAQT